MESAYYERYMLSKDKLLPEPLGGSKENPFLDSYVIDSLDLPGNFKEKDLRKGLIESLVHVLMYVTAVAMLLLSLDRWIFCGLRGLFCGC